MRRKNNLLLQSWWRDLKWSKLSNPHQKKTSSWWFQTIWQYMSRTGENRKHLKSPAMISPIKKKRGAPHPPSLPPLHNTHKPWTVNLHCTPCVGRQLEGMQSPWHLIKLCQQRWELWFVSSRKKRNFRISCDFCSPNKLVQGFLVSKTPGGR